MSNLNSKLEKYEILTMLSYNYKESIGEFGKQMEEANQIDTLALHYLDNRTRLHRHLAFQQVVENQNSNDSKKSIVTHLLILLVQNIVLA